MKIHVHAVAGQVVDDNKVAELNKDRLASTGKQHAAPSLGNGGDGSNGVVPLLVREAEQFDAEANLRSLERDDERVRPEHAPRGSEHPAQGGDRDALGVGAVVPVGVVVEARVLGQSATVGFEVRKGGEPSCMELPDRGDHSLVAKSRII